MGPTASLGVLTAGSHSRGQGWSGRKGKKQDVLVIQHSRSALQQLSRDRALQQARKDPVIETATEGPRQSTFEDLAPGRFVYDGVSTVGPKTE